MPRKEQKTAKKKDSSESEKLVYKLDEVSRITKLDKSIIESWEKEFYFIQSGYTGSGHKIFRNKDLAIILRLKELLENEGLTLAGAKRKLEEELGIKRTTSVHPDRLKKILYNVRKQLKDIAATLED
ncbi:MAG: MerR family transcriptional regulator [Candidatus Aminicenantes bacterium]|nr:MerR family transcriptional regulator [Candidatus Aminicenantes bacterium]